MRRGVWAALALIAVVPAVGAVETEGPPKEDPGKATKESEPAKPADQLRDLKAQFQKVAAELSKEYRAAKDDEARQKVLEKARTVPGDFAGRALSLAEKNPKDPAAFDALVWVIARFGRNTGSSEIDKAITILARDHASDPGMGSVCQALAGADTPAVEKLLRVVLEKNPKRDVQGQACLALAQVLRDRAEGQASQHDKAADANMKEAQKYYDLVVEKYADVNSGGRTLKEQAEGDVFELRHLALGQQAPDIEGVDSSGQKFKLSDYRGKVVVLDFWARW